MEKLRNLIESYIPCNEQEEADKAMMIEYMDTFRDTLTRNNKVCHFTASSWIVNKEKTKVFSRVPKFIARIWNRPWDMKQTIRDFWVHFLT